ncbi:hypothetical protein ACIOHE_39220 [Streptomyces sp. NPDC087851]|uniref:hypothetical protein n=1 Tax=Streptomyces sp. NPDC087851 TaxID=3365810 RepID=UPI00380326CF
MMNRDLERAIQRDNLLNPEEAAVWAATADALTRTRRRRVPAAPPAALLRKRVEEYVPLLRAAAWTATVTVHAGRARLEGARPDGAAVMVTASSQRDGVAVHRYVLHASGADWFTVGADAFEYFTERGYLPGGAARQRYVPVCRCAVERFPEERRAAARLLEIKIRRARQRRGPGQHPCRCPTDDRVWHLTKQQKNR